MGTNAGITQKKWRGNVPLASATEAVSTGTALGARASGPGTAKVGPARGDGCAPGGGEGLGHVAASGRVVGGVLPKSKKPQILRNSYSKKYMGQTGKDCSCQDFRRLLLL